MTVVTFVSPAPILRRGGHSQGWDEAAVDLAAFFGRVMIAVDYVAGFEARMSAAEPIARYAAFVSDCLVRYEAAPGAPPASIRRSGRCSGRRRPGSRRATPISGPRVSPSRPPPDRMRRRPAPVATPVVTPR